MPWQTFVQPFNSRWKKFPYSWFLKSFYSEEKTIATSASCHLYIIHYFYVMFWFSYTSTSLGTPAFYTQISKQPITWLQLARRCGQYGLLKVKMSIRKRKKGGLSYFELRHGNWCQNGWSEYWGNCWSAVSFVQNLFGIYRWFEKQSIQVCGQKCLDARDKRRMVKLAQADRKPVTVTNLLLQLRSTEEHLWTLKTSNLEAVELKNLRLMIGKVLPSLMCLDFCWYIWMCG